MNCKRLVALLALLACCSIALSGCSNPEEKAAKQQLTQALALEQQSDLPAARQMLGALQKQYPQTKAAAEALGAEQRILKQMDRIQRQMNKTLESMVLVIAGYQSMTGRPLVSLADLDSGDYLFDSSYLAEAVPEGMEAFVLLDGAGGFRLWVYRASTYMGMTRDHLKRHGQSFAGEEVIARLRSDYTFQPAAERLTVLAPVLSAEK